MIYADEWPLLSCELALEQHKLAWARGAVGQHLARCATCANATAEYFAALASMVAESELEFRSCLGLFAAELVSRSKEGQKPGFVDAASGFLIVLCEQLLADASRYRSEAPHSPLAALAWIQKAFFACRTLESQRLVESAPFETGKKPFVGEMPIDPADPTGPTFGTETSASTMLQQHLSYGTFTYNRELQERIVAEIHAGKFVHALVLICDSPKHGVLSSLLNLASTAQPEQIYQTGFRACSIAFRAFAENNGISLSPPNL